MEPILTGQLSEKIKSVLTDEISTRLVWDCHQSYVFESQRIGEIDDFYPVYRYQNYFSFSLLPLILMKGTIQVNEEFIHKFLRNGGDVAEPQPTIDLEIQRLGMPIPFIQDITDRNIFCELIAKAMNDDIRHICECNPGKTNVVLCGGKDSLNILLADWDAPVIALSAEPNFPLVKRFVEENGLSIEVLRLDDLEPSSDGLKREVAEASCLVDLAHWKWTEHLRRFSQERNGQVVFWKGQMADATLTDYWRSYTSRVGGVYQFSRKAYRKIARHFPRAMDTVFASHAISDVERSIWLRGAVGQGAHLGFLRSICDALFVSAYHGPQTSKVMKRINLRALATDDLRAEIGQKLRGRPVVYPETNPSPPASHFRQSKRDTKTYFNALESIGVKVSRRED